jgi:hypothetical protein
MKAKSKKEVKVEIMRIALDESVKAFVWQCINSETSLFQLRLDTMRKLLHEKVDKMRPLDWVFTISNVILLVKVFFF